MNVYTVSQSKKPLQKIKSRYTVSNFVVRREDTVYSEKRRWRGVRKSLNIYLNFERYLSLQTEAIVK